MRTPRKLLITLTLIVLFFLTLNLIRHYSIPSITYKKTIESFVARHTPYTLAVNGDLHISLFPNPELIINQVSLQNKKNSGTAPFFANVKELHLKVQWLPLLSRQLALKQIILSDAMIQALPHLPILFNGTINVNADARTASIPNYHVILNHLPLDGFATIAWQNPQNNNIRITFSATTNVAGGTITKTGTCDLNHTSKHMLINESIKITGVNLNPVLRAFNDKEDINGQLTGSILLNTNDNHGSWLNNLNGNGNISIKNASFGQLNVSSMINQNLTLLRFDTVTGTFNIKNGTLSNNNLNMTSKNLLATGAGTINLVNNTINYQLSLQEIAASSLKLPVNISGDLQHPTATVNVAKTLNNVVNTLLNDHKLNLKNLLQ